MHTSVFRALTHYRILPRLAGWRALVVAFAARAPYAMIPLGTMTAVNATTGKIDIAGYSTAAVALSTAIAGPLIGKWADRAGQRIPLRILTPINACALLAMACAVTFHAGLPLLFASCIAVGVTSLPIGSFTRSRWIAQTNVPRELAAALSYESMADELVFVLGPALVGLAASLAAPTAPLALAFVLVATAGMIFAFSPADTRRTPSPTLPHSTSADAPASVGVLRVIWMVFPSVIAMTAIGSYFGATQAAITSRAEFHGVAMIAGLIYAAMGIGSAMMAIMTVAIPARITLSQRILIGGCGMAVLMSIVAATTNLGPSAILLTTCGLFVGPSMVTAFSLTESLAPSSGMAIAMTSMQSSVTIGVSLGSAIGGQIARAGGHHAAFVVPVVAAVVVAAVGLGLVLKRQGDASARPINAAVEDQGDN